MLKVVAAVYMLSFLGKGPNLVPFDSMMGCEAAKVEIVQHLSVRGEKRWRSNSVSEDASKDYWWKEEVKKRAGGLAEALICVKAK